VQRDGAVAAVTQLGRSAERARAQARYDTILQGTTFAQPGTAAAHRVMQQSGAR
jgi:hypothetical protein